MRIARRFVPLGFVALAACSSSAGAPPSAAADADSGTTPASACPEGLRAQDDSCDAVVAASCGPGTMPVFGAEACAPVGIAACPAGWSRDETGWGCTPDLPSVACPAGTRTAIGSKVCVPVGDCSAPFPPPDAKLIVDGTTGANHFATISAAVHAAAPGDVIALAPGTYAEQVSVDKAVSFVGKCPAQTIMDDAGTRNATFLVDADGAIAFRNLAIRNQTGGGIDIARGAVTVSDVTFDNDAGFAVHVIDQGQVTIERTRIAGVRRRGPALYGSGVTAEIGGKATVRDSSVVGVEGPGLSAVESGATLDAERVVVSGIRAIPSSSEGTTTGVLSRSRAKVHLTECLVRDVRGGEGASAAASVLSLVRSRIDGVVAVSESVGTPIFVVEGGKATVDATTLADVQLLGAYVDGDKSTLAMTSSVVSGPRDAAHVVIGRGVQTVQKAKSTIAKTAFVRLHSAGIGFQQGGLGSVEDTFVTGVAPIEWPQKGTLYGGFGLLVENASNVSAARVSVDGATLSGVSSTTGASLVATDVLVRNVRELALAGIGSCAQVDHAKLDLTGFAFQRCAATSVIAGSADLVARRGVVTETTEVDGFAHGITLHRDAFATLDSVYVTRNGGIGLAANGARAEVRDGAFVANGVALHAQNGSFVNASDDASIPTDGELRVSTATKFQANSVRIGTGVVPLPGQ